MAARFVRRERWIVDTEDGKIEMSTDQMREAVNSYLKFLNMPSIGKLIRERETAKKLGQLPLITLEDQNA